MIKNLPASAGDAGDMGSIPGLERSPGEGNGDLTPVFLSGESHGHRSLVGCRPWSHEESDITEHTHTHICIRKSLTIFYQRPSNFKFISAYCWLNIAHIVVDLRLSWLLFLFRAFTRNSGRVVEFLCKSVVFLHSCVVVYCSFALSEETMVGICLGNRRLELSVGSRDHCMKEEGSPPNYFLTISGQYRLVLRGV